jgi:hypothetical protein
MRQAVVGLLWVDPGVGGAHQADTGAVHAGEVLPGLDQVRRQPAGQPGGGRADVHAGLGERGRRLQVKRDALLSAEKTVLDPVDAGGYRVGDPRVGVGVRGDRDTGVVCRIGDQLELGPAVL